MAGVGNVLPPALLSGSRDDREAESLKSILGRIYDERGHFRHITEESLQAELAAEESQENSSDTEDEEDEVAESDDADNRSRREQLYAARAEMLGHVASAQNEALMGLDFVSLLLSKDAPKQAELTMSPHLKQFVKPGTLGLDMWSNMPVDKERQDTDDMISRGWRLDSLQDCADSLLDAASRLEKIVKRETRYWEHVLSVSERGWSICRMPRERHNLGVRFGFLEALGEYRDRGLAALRADESGNVILDRGFANTSKCIRVRTRLGSQIVGISKPPATLAEPETSLESRIRSARDSLYEEELFHEITRESRTLASYGVDMYQSTIRLPTRLDGGLHETHDLGFDDITIDLVSPDEIGSEDAGDLPQNHYAQAVAVVFRLLLSHAHRERLKSRSSLPPPMSLSHRETPVAPILRPILSMFNHQSVSKEMDRYLDRIGALLTSASIEASTKLARFDRALLSHAGSMDLLMEKTLSPVHSLSTLSIIVPGRDEPFEFSLHLYTSSMAPVLGNKILVQSPVGLPSVEFSETGDLIDYMDAMVANALALGISGDRPGWRYNERLSMVSSPDHSVKVSVVVSSGMLETDGERLVLDTSGKKVEWRSGNTRTNERRFWDVVNDIK